MRADLAEFVHDHHRYGSRRRLSARVEWLHVTVACPCGVVFERGTPEDPERGLRFVALQH